jgi:hypothetical protein
LDTENNTGLDTGKNTGLDTGKNTGLNTGKNTGLDTGKNTGLDTGKNTGLDTGKNTGLDIGKNTGLNTGKNTGLDTGKIRGGFSAILTGDPPPLCRNQEESQSSLGKFLFSIWGGVQVHLQRWREMSTLHIPPAIPPSIPPSDHPTIPDVGTIIPRKLFRTSPMSFLKDIQKQLNIFSCQCTVSEEFDKEQNTYFD